jgi:hypothetical protein
MIRQLCSLERRTARGGKDSIDHPPGNHHDDIINSAAGSLTNLIIEDLSGGKAVLEVARRQMAAEKAAGTWPFAKMTSRSRSPANGRGARSNGCASRPARPSLIRRERPAAPAPRQEPLTRKKFANFFHQP